MKNPFRKNRPLTAELPVDVILRNPIVGDFKAGTVLLPLEVRRCGSKTRVKPKFKNFIADIEYTIAPAEASDTHKEN